MRSAALALALLAFADAAGAEGEGPRITADEILQEAAALEERARRELDAAHGMPPGAERNQVLSALRQVLKLGVEKYQLAAQVAPDRAAECEQKAGELKGMLFWCNKSMVVVVQPDRTPSVPAPVPGPAPSDPAPPPATEARTAPAALPVEEVTALLERSRALFERIEEASDLCAEKERSFRSVLALISRAERDWERGRKDPSRGTGISMAAMKAFEAKREALLEVTQDLHKKLRVHQEEIRKLKGELRPVVEQLESFQEAAVPLAAAWAERHKEPPLPENMLAYLNSQLSRPSFHFTPVGSREAFPAVAALDPKAVKDARALLQELGRLSAREEELALQAADAEAERDRLDGNLDELRFHRDWLAEYGAPSSDMIRKSQREEDALVQAKAKASERRKKAFEEKAALRGKLEDLRRRMKALDPSLARVVEEWRRGQIFLAASLSSELESWTRKALGVS